MLIHLSKKMRNEKKKNIKKYWPPQVAIFNEKMVARKGPGFSRLVLGCNQSFCLLACLRYTARYVQSEENKPPTVLMVNSVMNANNDSITSSKTNRRKQSAVKLGDLIGNQKKSPHALQRLSTPLHYGILF